MLKSLADLVAWTYRLAERVPELAAEIVLSDGGLSQDELHSIENSLGIHLPGTYRNMAGTKKLYGVSLGYFDLWPTYDSSEDLRGALVRANHEQGTQNGSASHRGLICVARQEANPICVRATGFVDEDAVFRIDQMSAPNLGCERIAGNFEQFLLLAGNLQFLTVEPVEGGSVTDAMTEVCRHLSLTVPETAFWVARAEENT
jgi:hypothetical protein